MRIKKRISQMGGYPRRTGRRSAGFSLVELMIVITIALILGSIAVPSIINITRNMRIDGDTRAIAAQLNLARMRGAADFSHGRLYMDLSGNTFRFQVWNKALGCWQTEGGSNNCPQTTSPVIALSQSDSFGFGSISAGPTAATSTIAQAPLCTTGVAGAAPGTTIANTACIEFNSRGYPVTSSNTIVASDAIYITNSSKLYSAVAVSISGQPTAYRYGGSAWASY